VSSFSATAWAKGRRVVFDGTGSFRDGLNKVRGEETSSAQRPEFKMAPLIDSKSDLHGMIGHDGFTEFLAHCVSGQRLSREKPSRRKWGREKKLTVSLFPGCLFRRFNLSDLFAVFNSFDAAPAVNAGNKPLVLMIPVSERSASSDLRAGQ
jgi:hypothetical protein